MCPKHLAVQLWQRLGIQLFAAITAPHEELLAPIDRSAAATSAFYH